MTFKHNLCQNSAQESEIIQVEVSKLLQKGVIITTTRVGGDFVSNMFTRQKKQIKQNDPQFEGV